MAPNKRMQDVVGVGLKKNNTFTLPATPRYPPRLRPGRKAYFIRFPTVHPLHRKNRRTFWLKNQHETPAFSRSPNSFSIARSRRSEKYSSVSAYEYELGVKSPLTGRVGKGGFREVGLDGIVHDRYPPPQPSKTTAHVVYPPDCARFAPGASQLGYAIIFTLRSVNPCLVASSLRSRAPQLLWLATINSSGGIVHFRPRGT